MLSFGAVVVNLVLLAGPATPGQSERAGPSPPLNGISDQDELDLTGRSSIVLGAGARALGMGGAFLARPDDATAATWNPAGLSYLRRPEVSLVGDFNTLDTTIYTSGGLLDTSSHAENHTLDFGAVTYPVSLGGSAGSVQISYQRAIPFNGDRYTQRNGLDIHYEGSGGFDVLAFGLGFKVTRQLRVGATLNRWIDGYDQTTVRTPTRRTIRHDSFGIGAWNVNLGLIWSPIESLNFGAVGKTPFTSGVTLSRERTDFTDATEDEPSTSSSTSYSSSDVSLDFPGAWGVGASWRPRSTLTVSSDYTRTYWSKAQIHNYFTLLPIPPGGVNTFETLPWPTIDAAAQADSQQVRLGVEYVMFKGPVKVPLRGGYVNDQQYVIDQSGQAPHFNAVTAGTGLIVGSMLLDVAYLYESGSYVDTNGAKNTARTNRLYASVIYRWGGIK
jgi:long-subunit fatty acid transport protein